MTTRVTVNPALLQWARERAALRVEDLTRRFPKLPEWERGNLSPTLRQLEQFAQATRTPIGYLFLPEPPAESLPIPDFRTLGGARISQASPDLIDTLFLCEQRQEWYRDFARAAGEDPLPFVGSLALTTPVIDAAAAIRDALRFDVERRRALPTWSEALREFIAQADEAGILVMCSGIVGSNTRRRLDPSEFRGFAIIDPLAPLVFVNGADTRSAQMFTLAHELAHIWLGQSALSDSEARHVPDHKVERWCNEVAAELLVPLDLLRRQYRPSEPLHTEVARLSRWFKVSTLVTLRRIYDAGGLTADGLREAYDAEVQRLQSLPRSPGGNFYLTLPARVSKRFARALVASTLEGHTLYRDALRMLGFSKLSAFDELGRSLGVVG